MDPWLRLVLAPGQHTDGARVLYLGWRAQRPLQIALAPPADRAFQQVQYRIAARLALLFQNRPPVRPRPAEARGRKLPHPDCALDGPRPAHDARERRTDSSWQARKLAPRALTPSPIERDVGARVRAYGRCAKQGKKAHVLQDGERVSVHRRQHAARPGSLCKVASHRLSLPSTGGGRRHWGRSRVRAWRACLKRVTDAPTRRHVTSPLGRRLTHLLKLQ